MRRAFAVLILLLTACGSASDEKADAKPDEIPDEKASSEAPGVPAEGKTQALAPPGKAIVWRGSETDPHDLDTDAASCTEKFGINMGLWGQCMLEKGWRLEER